MYGVGIRLRSSRLKRDDDDDDGDRVAKGMPLGSVPYASCSVMRDALLASCLYFLDGVIKKEVNQDGVDVDIRMVSFYLPPDEFNTPDAASCGQ